MRGLCLFVIFTFSCSHMAAIIEHVRDGCTVRALLLPDHYLVTIMLSGVKVSVMTILYPFVTLRKINWPVDKYNNEAFPSETLYLLILSFFCLKLLLVTLFVFH